ncbi:MAG TPA: amidophosphoribosyltransferase [Clostridiales bacterium]|nr:amidophosphoribosyltransferase [Clostridiales bacterium]
MLYKSDFLLDKPREECGVFGIYDVDGIDCVDICYYGLYALQHRGQDSAGIAVSTERGIIYHKQMGLVVDVFTMEKLQQLDRGNIAIGHVRHSLAGDCHTVNAQPLVIKYKGGDIALAHNGKLTNALELRQELEESGAIFQTSIDSEVIATLIAQYRDQDLVTAVKKTLRRIKGSYAITMMAKDKLIGIRDPHGIRPLALGKINNSYVLASETCAFDVIGADYIRDVKPGEIIIIDKNGLTSIQTEVPLKSGLCIFEFVYLARTDSIIDGISVYQARMDAGRYLAMEHPADVDMVIGVPDSGTTAAIGFAEQSNIPYGEGLIKNRYVGRTFIQPSQSMREQALRIKLNALRKMVQGKRIAMVDDSIVRGTTSKMIVDMLRTAGAREVHMRISSPPVVSPCYFGMDTPSTKQLIGAAYTVEEIEKLIGADSLGYISIESLLKTVEGSSCQFCTGCFDGRYPMEVSCLNKGDKKCKRREDKNGD